jgi:hypothetical protein
MNAKTERNPEDGPTEPRPQPAGARIYGLNPPGKLRAAAVRPAIFIHSSWRTGSTWFWQQFRHCPATLCYYEPFHEGLAKVTRPKARRVGPASWASGHPQGAPYHLEFLPLIRQAGGVRLFVPEIAYDWFVPEGGIAGCLRRQEVRYLGLLLRHAARRDKIAVFGFTRSLGRLAALKRRFSGTHIFLYRNLWTHWASYTAQRHAGNDYFITAMLRVLLQAQERVFAALIARPLARALAAGALPPDGGGDLAAALARALPEAELFGLFMALHLYLYACAQVHADLAIDVTRLARERDYREAIGERLLAATGLPLALADVADRPQAHWPAPDGIDWREIRENFDFAVHAVDHLFDGKELARIGAALIEDTLAELRTGERYLGTARAEIARLREQCERAEAELARLRRPPNRAAGRPRRG